MHHFQLSLKLKEPANIEQVLSQFAVESFPFGRAAYPLTSGMYNVDAGENDFRAVDSGNGIINFICREQRDADRYERKIREFAENHPSDCVLVMASAISSSLETPH